MNKRAIASLLGVAVVAASLAGCSLSGSDDLSPRDLTVEANITALCGDTADGVYDLVASAYEAPENSGKRNALKEWGIEDPKDEEALDALLETLAERTEVACSGDEENQELSDEIRELLDASGAPREACVTVVEETAGTVVEGIYPLFIKALHDTRPADASAATPGYEYKEFSTALSTALVKSGESLTLAQLNLLIKRAICEEPVVGVSLAHLFAHLEVKGVRVLDLQQTEWLDTYNVDADEINDLVADFVPHFLVESKSDKQYSDAYTANLAYQDLADKLIFLLSRYSLIGVGILDTSQHYELVAGGLVADGIPEVGLVNGPDDKPALIFALTGKTECQPISVLGFNLLDKRPQLGVVTEDCDAPPPGGPDCVGYCGETPPPPEDCPPGDLTPRCSPKVGPWYGDPEKGPVTLDGPVEETPTDVITEEIGGGGVEDTAENDPGTESGGDAPGAGDVGNEERETNTNQGGENKSGDTGGF